MESERDIEKRLKAYAAKRRQDAGAPLELHPATRWLLQGAAARRRPKPAGDESWLARAFAAMRPQFAVAACVLVGLAIAAAVFLPMLSRSKSKGSLVLGESSAILPTQPVELAKVKSTEPVSGPAEPAVAGGKAGEAAAGVRLDQVATATESGVATQPPTAEKPLADQPMRLGDAETRKAGRAETVVTSVAGYAETKAGADESRLAWAYHPSPAPLESAVRGALAESAKSAKPEIAMGLPAVTAPASPAPPATVVFDRVRKPLPGSGGAQQPAPVITQNFAQVELPAARRVAAKQTPVQTVLNSFRVEQSGDRIQIVDNDGSTYAGYARLVGTSKQLDKDVAAVFVADAFAVKRESMTINGAKAAKAPVGVQLAPPPASEISPTEGQNYAFHVTGTNRALNEPVVFTGNLFLPTNVAVAPVAPAMDAKGAQLLKMPIRQDQLQRARTQFQNWRVNGTAVVGKHQTISVDAEAVLTP